MPTASGQDSGGGTAKERAELGAARFPSRTSGAHDELLRVASSRGSRTNDGVHHRQPALEALPPVEVAGDLRAGRAHRRHDWAHLALTIWPIAL